MGCPAVGVYERHAPEYASAGLATFPVDTRGKRPMVKNWQRATLRAAKAWTARFGDADGIGLNMGPQSRITEVDVDTAGDAALGTAIERYGESPVSIRTASGKSKIWYRHGGEARMIRPVAGEDIDLLGAGFSIAPPSWRGDLGTGYRFLTGSLADIDRLPGIRGGALEYTGRAAETVAAGRRNDTLFRYCMVQARFCDDAAALIDAAETWAGAMPDPLPLSEVAKVARSTWSYEVRGRNFIGLRRPVVSSGDANMETLADEPEAFFLLSLFRRYHANREAFSIAPTAMSQARNPPWHRSRIERARDALLERGLLEQVEAPCQKRARAGRYRLAGRLPQSGNNHFTPSHLP